MKPAVKCLDMEDLAVVSECLQALYDDCKLGSIDGVSNWDDDAWDAMRECCVMAAERCGIVLVDNYS